jgi:predicted DNA-binding ArsR family transcriptional regulator
MNRKSEKFNKNFFTNWLNKIKEIIDKMEKEMKEYINQLQQNIKNSEEYFDDLVKQINNESLLLDYAFAYKNKVIFNKEKLF